MHLTRLALTDFRSYPELSLELVPGVTTFSGANGEGKTNLVEAVGYLATLGSHRVASDAPLVRRGAERAVLRGAVTGAQGSTLVEIELNPGRANRVRLNRAPQSRPRDILGALCTVLFAPEDLALVMRALGIGLAVEALVSPGSVREDLYGDFVELLIRLLREA